MFTSLRVTKPKYFKFCQKFQAEKSYSKLFNSLTKKSFSSSQNNHNIPIYPDRFIDYFLKPSFYNYKDNTLFIDKILQNNFTELILFPENYGKTFNLETLRFFLSSNILIDERVDKQMRIDFFSKTKIFSTTTFNSQFAKFPVISINFRELDQNNYRDNVEKFRFLLNLQFEQVLQYMQSKEHKENLTNIDIKNIEEFFFNYKNYKETLLFNSCKDLTKILLKITKQNPFFIIDDYDYPLLNSLKNNFHEDMLGFMESFFNISIKNNNFVNKSIIAGVNKVSYNKLFSQLSNVIEYKEDQKKFFGFKDFVMPRLNKEKFANDLYLREFFSFLIDENSENYIAGMKMLVNLKNLTEGEFSDSPKESQVEKLQETKSIEFNKKISTKFLENYLYYNGIINNHGVIANSFYSDIVKQALPELDDPNSMKFDFNKKLAYGYYNFLFNNNLEGYMEYLKNLFEFVVRIMKNKKLQNTNSHLLPDFNLQFRSEKEFETYLVDILTLEMNNDESNERIQIYSVDDDEVAKLKPELKKFTLITYEDKQFAIFVKGNKIKIRNSSSSKQEEENFPEETNIEEILNNPNLTKISNKSTSEKSTSKKPFQIVPPEIILSELKKKNEEILQGIDRQEAINFLTKISTDFEIVYFISVSNYNKQIDYSMEIVKLEKE
jgi:hypothetical protein